jgi:hypothetical protein
MLLIIKREAVVSGEKNNDEIIQGVGGMKYYLKK